MAETAIREGRCLCGAVRYRVTGEPLWQVPAWQLSATVQALPSLQAVPSGAGGLVQPMGARQTPAT